MADHSGKFNVRIPPSLHRALAQRAEGEGVSLNQLVTALLAGGLGWAIDGKPARFTKAEASALLYAASTIGDDLDQSGLDAGDKRAYHRGMDKLRTAVRSA